MTNHDLPQVSTECELCDDVFDFAVGNTGQTPERLDQATRHANECHRCRAIYGDDAPIFELLSQDGTSAAMTVPEFRRPRRWQPGLAAAAALLVVIGAVVFSRSDEVITDESGRSSSSERIVEAAESSQSIEAGLAMSSRALSEFTTVVKLTPKGPQVLETAHVRRSHEKD